MDWLEPGWDAYNQEALAQPFLLRPLAEGEASGQGPGDDSKRIDAEAQTYVECFADDAERVQAFAAWTESRKKWAERQKVLVETRNFFSELYKIQLDLERNSETWELVAADGFLLDRETPEIAHPILTRRVKMRHDAIENTLYVEDADVETELYTVLFQGVEGINRSAISQLQDDLEQNAFHPFDRSELPVYFKKFVHQLSSESLYAEDGVPDDWQKKDRFLLYRNPCYILRKRMDGAQKAIAQIIEHIEATGEVPAPILDLVEGGKLEIPEDTEPASIEERLASVGGESVDILLSKEANKEQLEIARRIEQYNAVLVQGPPGTGKTHTIANLLGHFLAQGKSVLVTSHTQKALRVLKEKVVPGLRNLCVSMLDDSNADMEKSIDGITDYLSQYSSFELQKEMESLGQERKTVIRDLADVRRKLFAMIHRECSGIVYNGEEFSPSAAAAFVRENRDALSYIPGPVRLYAPLPLDFAELVALYRSNGELGAQEEAEFALDLPDPTSVPGPDAFAQLCDALCAAEAHLRSLSLDNHWEISIRSPEDKIVVKGAFGELLLDLPPAQAVQALEAYLSSFPAVEPWMQHCAVDGRKGRAYRQLWTRLVDQIQETCAYAEKLTAEKFGKEVLLCKADDPAFPKAMEQLEDWFRKGRKLGKVALFLHKELGVAQSGATINGQMPQSAEDCALVLHVLEMRSKREQCAAYWKDLMGKHGVPLFFDLDSEEPERVAANSIPLILRYLDWFENEYAELVARMEAAGLPCEEIFQRQSLDSENIATAKILSAVETMLPKICEVLSAVQTIRDRQGELAQILDTLQSGKRVCSDVCKALLSAAEARDVSGYRGAYAVLEATHAKADLHNRREEALNRLAPVAPQWADAIRHREGIHGSTTVPDNIDEAWKWKQYAGIVEEITAEPFSVLQEKSVALSKEYRRITAEYAEKSAWYHLLRRTEHEISMKQALQGWKLTVKKIGKGTGKNAPMYRAEARKLMVLCQKAVPAWIMPIGKALESLNPRTNRFDIVIIDEASQSDISALAILYMGKKLIIVGDDKQVSPMAVGIPLDRIQALRELYIAGKIPNAHLYDGKTSIYDIAATTFQPLMLREHFRCVPEIIRFSNWLSYSGKIKPLRDGSSSALLPAVVNYRVADGKRVGKSNPNEAKAIVALLQACIEQPEYAGKSFGILSLLGDEQVKLLQEEVYRRIDARECSARKILCGTASNFQGDERDVVFLSVVDCGSGEGPLAKQGSGADDANQKRYNVAASRARDQLWVVHSLDPANDLKTGDLRKMLIDYALHPASLPGMEQQIEERAESPFEAEVAKALTMRGYQIVQQWEVGAYRLDMVAMDGNRRIAIECDGERYHNGEEKIRADMERQTILERLGWRFLRIRGSEYYRDPEAALERLVAVLTAEGIHPASSEAFSAAGGRDTDLLQRVKRRALELLQEDDMDSPSATEDGFLPGLAG
ncbi:MAG: AAA domain-containing protein [Candidatus Spyradocola sp.]